MGIAQPHALGRTGKFYAKAETTPGTFAKPSGTDAFKALKLDIDFKQERKDRADSRQTRSVLERITGRKETTWSTECYLVPSGTKGVAPDVGPLLKAALGVETVNAATSVVYSLTKTQGALGTLSLVRHYSDVVMEAVTGAAVESLKLTISGGDEPKLAIEGPAMGHIHTGTAELENAASATDETITLTAASVANVEVGSVVKVGADDNSGAGYSITSVDASTGACGISPALGTGVAAGALVTPFAPAEVTAGSPVAGILGGITVDGGTLHITGAELTIKNNLKPVNDEAFADSTTDYIEGFREVTGSLTVRARRDVIALLAQRKSFSTSALQIVCGSIAGSILTVSIPYAEFEFAPLEVPEADEGTFQLPFRALASSAGEDEITLTFT